MNHCRLAQSDDAAAIQAIYAPIVRKTAISFEYDPPDVAEMAGRMSKVLATRPWLVYRAGGRVLGYAYASTFRERRAYDWSTEVSVYVHADARGRGVGKELYATLFDVLRALNYRQVIAGATLPNEHSERLHEALGFERIGIFPAVGYKFGKWHDVIFWALTLRDFVGEAPALINVNELLQRPEWEWLTSE
ncbi:MAG TPA: arsinothricin resistance N-acetyltransferase ArsN1 family B [Longimicrobiales bacterium]